MDKKEKEDLINSLLVFMNEDIEKAGEPIKFISFNFSQGIVSPEIKT